MSCGEGCRCGSEPTLLWLWHRLAATAPNGPQAWEPPYAMGAALKKGKIINNNNIKNDTNELIYETGTQTKNRIVTRKEWVGIN